MGDVNKITNKIEADVTAALGLHDFYSAHLMTFCEGYYEPNGTAASASENVTYCSNQTTMYFFDPTSIVNGELKKGISLGDIKWPQDIQDGIDALRVASNAMFVLYVLGIALTGVLLITSLVGIFYHHLLLILTNSLLALVSPPLPARHQCTLTSPAQLAFFSIGAASAIATAIIVKATNLINSNGSKIGLVAYRGSKFLGMTWAATALLLVAAIAWSFDCCLGAGAGSGRRGTRTTSTWRSRSRKAWA